jgi:hypothetical protein
MCWCIKVVANLNKSIEEQRDRGHVPYSSIKSQIPEFNPWYLKAHKAEYLAINRHLQEGLEFWWDVELVEPRIKAFDTLIKVYENSDREFVW